MTGRREIFDTSVLLVAVEWGAIGPVETRGDLAEASLHLHIGLTVLVDVSFAVLTAKPKFVVEIIRAQTSQNLGFLKK